MFAKFVVLFTLAVAVSASDLSSFSYNVADPYTGDFKSQIENRAGNNVNGQYSLLESDGTRRTVDYAAGAGGFNAVVRKDPALIAAAPIAAPLTAGIAATPLATGITAARIAAAPIATGFAAARIAAAPVATGIAAAPITTGFATARLATAPIAAGIAAAPITTGFAAPLSYSAYSTPYGFNYGRFGSFGYASPYGYSRFY